MWHFSSSPDQNRGAPSSQWRHCHFQSHLCCSLSRASLRCVPCCRISGFPGFITQFLSHWSDCIQHGEKLWKDRVKHNREGFGCQWIGTFHERNWTGETSLTGLDVASWVASWGNFFVSRASYLSGAQRMMGAAVVKALPGWSLDVTGKANFDVLWSLESVTRHSYDKVM